MAHSRCPCGSAVDGVCGYNRRHSVQLAVTRTPRGVSGNIGSVDVPSSPSLILTLTLTHSHSSPITHPNQSHSPSASSPSLITHHPSSPITHHPSLDRHPTLNAPCVHAVAVACGVALVAVLNTIAMNAKIICEDKCQYRAMTVTGIASVVFTIMVLSVIVMTLVRVCGIAPGLSESDKVWG